MDSQGSNFYCGGTPEKLHSDQAQNFESYILSELCRAFRITKSRITPYHLMGDGLVEWINRTLLSLLHIYTESYGDWEEHFQLLLFAYCTTKHSSTKLSPHEVLFGYTSPSLIVHTSNMPEPMDPAKHRSNWNSRKTETGVETEKGMGTHKYCCYSLDSLPMKFTELCKPSHKYSIVLKFFQSHNKRQPTTQYITWCHLRSILMIQLLKPHCTTTLIQSCFTIWLNLSFQYRNNRHLWLQCMMCNNTPTVFVLSHYRDPSKGYHFFI